jgi:pyrimidine deaminase RibD-like protein
MIYLQGNGSQTLSGTNLMAAEDNQQKMSTMTYATFEPCCYTGKRTPPCTMALVHAGVGRMVVGFCDPSPRVDGT